MYRGNIVKNVRFDTVRKGGECLTIKDLLPLLRNRCSIPNIVDRITNHTRVNYVIKLHHVYGKILWTSPWCIVL